MKGRDHTFTIAELTADPWIFFLAIMIGLITLFFFCAARVQADMPATSAFDASAKATEKLPTSNLPGNQASAKAWTWDFSDISNERTKPADSPGPPRLKGSVQSEGKRSLLDSIKSFFVGSPHDSSEPPVFIGP
jgi:hypothetical protein